MKRQYVITIVAKKAHQPSQDAVFSAVRELVNARAKEFPIDTAGTRVSLMTKGQTKP